MVSLAALAVAGTAAWTWSQEAAPPAGQPFQVQLDRVEFDRTIPAPPGAQNAAGTIFVQDGTPSFVQAQPAGEIRVRTLDSEDAVSTPANRAVIRGNGVGDVIFTATAPQPPHAGFRAVPRTRSVVEWSYVPLREEEQAEQKELKSLIETLNSDKPAEKKAEAKKQLSALLDKQFARDVERREKEVTELEDRVKKLRDQVDKRKAAKDKIISLRLDTIQNEADGLGFPDLSGGPREVNAIYAAPGFPHGAGVSIPGPPAISVYGTSGAASGGFLPRGPVPTPPPPASSGLRD